MYTSNPDLSHLPSMALTDLKEITQFYLWNIKIQMYHSAAGFMHQKVPPRWSNIVKANSKDETHDADFKEN